MSYQSILPKFNITQLNEMQLSMIDAFNQQSDITLISPTGSGKTLAFFLPLVAKIEAATKGDILALIIVPTRELALQIEQVFKQMGTPHKINCCYGGHSVRIEKNNLSQTPAVLVGTPGRIAYHVRENNINLSKAQYLILDEFDKSLEAGFQEEMAFIIQQMKKVKSRILTSATAIKEIPKFVGLKDPIMLDFTQGVQQPLVGLEQFFVRVPGDDKLEALMLLIGQLQEKSAIVFCNHRDAVNRISDQLHKHKIIHGFYHGGLEQIDREKTLIKMRNGTTRLIITTDLASRGLDIPEIDVVVHYQLPLKEDAMIHRNGRTARMNANGEVYFLLDASDYLPEYLEEKPKEITLPNDFKLPPAPKWKTLFIKAGKKDKINKMDIVGMLLQKGKLIKDDLGKIEVLDHSAYVAVNAAKLKQTLILIKEEKLKGRKIRMEEAS
ncbi:MAG: DEAD/DEAH box helicase [bacterium]|nr:DEAD/DEAH box helicase [bacterium]